MVPLDSVSCMIPLKSQFPLKLSKTRVHAFLDERSS